MYFSDTFACGGKLEADIRPATTYENRGDGYRDHPDPSSHWLRLCHGASIINLRLTAPQLSALHHAIGHALQDIGERAKLADVVEATVSGEGPDVG